MESSKMLAAVHTHTHTHTGNQLNEQIIINNERVDNISVGEDASVRPLKGNNQKGITLLALIITIIVLLILSVVSVKLITKSGIIEKAKLATLKHEIAKYDEELKLYIAAHREVNETPINTSGYENMKKYIPSFKKKYEDKLKISNNKLVYMNDNVSDAEREIFNNAGIRSDEMTQIYYLDENNKEQVLEINDATISETSYTSKNIAKENITKVIIGSSCTKIQKGAFENCTSLKNVTADTTEDVTLESRVFAGCNKIENIKITKIKFEGGETFYRCSNLQNLELGSTEYLLTNIGSWPISGCTNEKLVIKAYLQENVSIVYWEKQTNATIICYDEKGEESEIIIGTKYKGTDISWESLSEFEGIKDANKIIKIQTSAFEGCKNLKLESLPKNIEEIGSSAFKNCSSIQVSEIPSTCTKIGSNAFENCTSLKNITADTTEEVTLESRVFAGCNKIENIKITKIKFKGGETFYGCSNLQNLELGSTEYLLTNIGSWPINGCTNEKLVIKAYLQENVSIVYWEKQTNATIMIYNENGDLIYTREGK